MTQAHDLTTIEGLRACLLDGPYAAAPEADAIESLVGGVSGFTSRIRLARPLETGETSVVTKHIEGYGSEGTSWTIGQERIDFEVGALTAVYNAPFMKDSIVQVPRVIHYDRATHTVFLSDCGSIPNLKRFITENPSTSPELCGRIGSAVGTFLASMHSWSRGQTELLERFSNNHPGTYVSAKYHYGHLTSSCKTLGLYNPSKPDDAWVKTLADQYVAEINSREGSVLTHGDFWNGNILVDLKGDDLRIWILDWEMSKRGTADFDIGAFLAEAHCLSFFRRGGTSNGPSPLTTSFLHAYRDQARRDGLPVEVDRVTVKAGNHLLVVMPIVAWSTDEGQVKELANAGMEMLRDGWRKEGSKSALVRDLM